MIVGLSSQHLPAFNCPPDQFLSTARFRTADLVSSNMIDDGVSVPVARWRSSLGRDAITRGYSHHTVILQNSGEDVRRVDAANLTHRRSKPGSLLILPSGMDAAWRSNNVSDRTHFYVHPELVQQVSLEIHGRYCSIRNDCMFVFDEPFKNLLERYSFLAQSTTASRFELEMTMLEIATTLVRRYSNLASDSLGKGKPSQGVRLGLFIDTNLSKKLRARDIASALGMSESCLKKVALDQFGMPLHQYVLERRLDDAEKLVKRGVHIAQAALDCGFSSQSHLTSTMSARRGVTPALLAKPDFEKL